MVRLPAGAAAAALGAFHVCPCTAEGEMMARLLVADRRGIFSSERRRTSSRRERDVKAAQKRRQRASRSRSRVQNALKMLKNQASKDKLGERLAGGDLVQGHHERMAPQWSMNRAPIADSCGTKRNGGGCAVLRRANERHTYEQHTRTHTIPTRANNTNVCGQAAGLR